MKSTATELGAWRDRIMHAARRTLGEGWPDDPLHELSTFEDEAGFSPRVSGWLIAWLCRDRVSGQAAEERLAHAADSTGEVGLWRALMRGDFAAARAVMLPGPGAPLLDLDAETSIEVRTESELCALHAAWHLARLTRDDNLHERCVRAARWHVENLQPDNATNHPWAIHVFVLTALRLGDAEASLYAQTLLHNSQVSLGRPDRLSAAILLDAARALETAADPATGGLRPTAPGRGSPACS